MAGTAVVRRVSLGMEKTAAKIVVEQPDDGLDTDCMLADLQAAVEECARRRSELRVIFLWVVGGQPGRPHSPPLPIWAGGGNPNRHVERVQPAIALSTFLAALDPLTQPLVGLADGQIQGLGTNLLAACDLVIATRRTELEFELGAALEGDRGRAHPTIDVESARKLGFVTRVTASAVTLLDECAALHAQLAACPAEALHWTKQQMRSARLATLSPEPECGDGRRAEQPVLQPTLQSALQTPPAPPGLTHPADGKENSPTREATKPRRGGPKKTDLLAQYSAYDGPITTMMICNIPCRITQEQLIEAVDSMGFAEKFDFLYLPTGCRSSGSTTVASSNLGYGFVNFQKCSGAALFAEAFRDFHFKGSRSAKVCTVRPAHIQGLANNILHFGRSTGKSKPRSLLVRPVVKASLEALVQLKDLGLSGFDSWQLETEVDPDAMLCDDPPLAGGLLQIERLHL